MLKNCYLSRLVDKRLDFYLSTFGAVCFEGPKWCGKTWTCTMHAKSEFLVGSPAGNFANRQLARLDVNRALKGEAPHLIDEWQEVPAIWDAVRASVDERAEAGRYKEVWAGARAAAEVIAEGEDESRFERIRQLTQGNAPCYTIKRLKGRNPLNGPWCIRPQAEVPNKVQPRRLMNFHNSGLT